MPVAAAEILPSAHWTGIGRYWSGQIRTSERASISLKPKKQIGHGGTASRCRCLDRTDRIRVSIGRADRIGRRDLAVKVGSHIARDGRVVRGIDPYDNVNH